MQPHLDVDGRRLLGHGADRRPTTPGSNPAYQDPWVDYAARNTYDANYTGTGNWPFNTAYAGRFGLEGFVTRLRSLNEAERFIAAGIPLVFSLSFKKGRSPGSTYGTNGHLLVARRVHRHRAAGPQRPGLAAAATPTSARPWAAPSSRRHGWTPAAACYVIHPASVAPPAPPSQPNW